MIPKETNCAYVRISNLKQRMTEAEAATLDKLVKGKTIKARGGISIPKALWNNQLRPIMLNKNEDTEVLLSAWEILRESYKKTPRLYSALQNAKVSIKEKDNGQHILEFSVTNEAQEAFIKERLLREMQNNFQRLTKDYTILRPIVDETTAKVEIYKRPAPDPADLKITCEAIIEEYPEMVDFAVYFNASTDLLIDGLIHKGYKVTISKE